MIFIAAIEAPIDTGGAGVFTTIYAVTPEGIDRWTSILRNGTRTFWLGSRKTPTAKVPINVRYAATYGRDRDEHAKRN